MDKGMALFIGVLVADIAPLIWGGPGTGPKATAIGGPDEGGPDEGPAFIRGGGGAPRAAGGGGGGGSCATLYLLVHVQHRRLYNFRHHVEWQSRSSVPLRKNPRDLSSRQK